MKKTRRMLMPDVYLTILDTDKFRTNCLSLNLLRPLRQEEAAMNALLPDVLLRGCGLCPDMEAISAWLDERYGAGIQAMVRKRGEVQDIGFFLDYIDERFAPAGEGLTEDMCRLMGSFLLDPVTENGVFRRDYVDGERVNLVNAIMAQINDKRTYAATRLRQEMFAGEAYGVSRYGDRESVEAITPEALFAHYRHILAHSRIELVFAGRAEEGRLTAALQRALEGLPRAKTDPVSTRPHPEAEGVRQVEETMDVIQGNLVMGFQTGITSADREYPALLMLNTIFGGGITSKLFLNVRERLSLCYYASSGLDRFKGVMVVSSGVDMDKYQPAREEILRQLEACRRGDITGEEMEAARSALTSSLRASGDSLGRMEDFYLSQEIGGFTYTPEALAKALGEVTVAQVQDAARRVRLDTVFFLKGGAQ